MKRSKFLAACVAVVVSPTILISHPNTKTLVLVKQGLASWSEWNHSLGRIRWGIVGTKGNYCAECRDDVTTQELIELAKMVTNKANGITENPFNELLNQKGTTNA